MEELEQLEGNLSSNEKFGKFKDAESLLKAYSNLESEFTKKSQKLAALESEKVKFDAENERKESVNKRVDEFVNKFEAVKPFSSTLKEILTKNSESNLQEEAIALLSNNYKSAEFYANDGEFLNNYILTNQELKDKIVKDYLSQITQNSPIKMESGTGSISLTPPSVPTTVAEAGKLAKSIIKYK